MVQETAIATCPSTLSSRRDLHDGLAGAFRLPARPGACWLRQRQLPLHACHILALHSHSGLASHTAILKNADYDTLVQAFLFDTTGSMGSYIASATANIEKICDAIVSSNMLPSSEALRLAVIAYRDHPPQDVSYVTKTLPFTSDVGSMKEFLKNLYASGGGDGPEAVCASMMESLDLEWRPNASRMVVSWPIHVWWQKQLTVSADPHCRRGRSSGRCRSNIPASLTFCLQPPHGIGEYGDGFPNGHPGGMLGLPCIEAQASDYAYHCRH